MADKYYALSESDRAYFREMFDEWASSRVNTEGRARDGSVDHQEHQAPEVYVAVVPSSGIRAVASKGTQTRVFWALCQVYRLVTPTPFDDTYQLLTPVPGLTRRVYNFADDPVVGNNRVLVNRDKYGRWWVSSPCCSNPATPGTGTAGTGTGTHVPFYPCPDHVAAGASTCQDGGDLPDIPLTLQLHLIDPTVYSCVNGGSLPAGTSVSLNYATGSFPFIPVSPAWYGSMLILSDDNSSAVKLDDGGPRDDPPHFWEECHVIQFALDPCGGPNGPPVLWTEPTSGAWDVAYRFCKLNSSCRPLAWYFKSPTVPATDPCVGPQILVTA